MLHRFKSFLASTFIYPKRKNQKEEEQDSSFDSEENYPDCEEAYRYININYYNNYDSSNDSYIKNNICNNENNNCYNSNKLKCNEHVTTTTTTKTKKQKLQPYRFDKKLIKSYSYSEINQRENDNVNEDDSLNHHSSSSSSSSPNTAYRTNHLSPTRNIHVVSSPPLDLDLCLDYHSFLHDSNFYDFTSRRSVCVPFVYPPFSYFLGDVLIFRSPFSSDLSLALYYFSGEIYRLKASSNHNLLSVVYRKNIFRAFKFDNNKGVYTHWITHKDQRQHKTSLRVESIELILQEDKKCFREYFRKLQQDIQHLSWSFLEIKEKKDPLTLSPQPENNPCFQSPRNFHLIKSIKN